MIRILIIAHAEIANGFACCIRQIFDQDLENLTVLAVERHESSVDVLARGNAIIQSHHELYSGTIILSDIFGATPSNIARQLIDPEHVEMICGLNLPMLIRAISNCNETLEKCISSIIDGGNHGIFHVKGAGYD